MTMPSACRVCLSVNLPLFNVNIQKLINVYEKLTNSKYNEVGYPVSMCYMCLSVLWKCHRFMETAQDSNNALEQWHKENNKHMAFKVRPLYNLSTSTQPNVEINMTYDPAIENSREIKKEGVAKDVYIEVERLTNEEINNIENDIASLYHTVAIVDTDNNNVTHSVTDNETKSFIYEEWPKEIPQLNNEIWVEAPAQDPADNLYLLRIEPGCSKNVQDAAGTSNPRINQDILKTDVKIEIGRNNPMASNEIPDGFNPILQSDGNYYIVDSVYHPSSIQFYDDTNGFHLRNLNIEKSYLNVVNNCNKPGTSASSLNMNEKHLNKTKPKYRSKYSYRPKTKSRCLQRPKSYSCPECSQTFPLKCLVTKHLRSHSDKPFSCDICGFKYTVKGSLIKHMRTHTGVKPFACKICSYKTGQQFYLTRHMRSHTGEKLFACELCEYKCIEKSKLTNHMRTHTGEKPFSCNLCNFRSIQKNGLTVHMRKHTGEKPFSCSLCEYKCARGCQLKKHVLHKHEAKVQPNTLSDD